MQPRRLVPRKNRAGIVSKARLRGAGFCGNAQGLLRLRLSGCNRTGKERVGGVGWGWVGGRAIGFGGWLFLE